MDPLSIAASTAGLLTITAQIISRGYACIARIKSNDEDVRTAVNEVASFSGVLTAIESQCRESAKQLTSPLQHLIVNNQPSWKTKVEECEAVLIEMTGVLDTLAKANTAQLLVKGSSLNTKLEKLTAQVEKSKSFFILCLQLQNNEDTRASQKLSGKIVSSLDLLRDEQDRVRREAELRECKEQRQSLMEWLAFPGEAMQEEVLSTGHPDSSQWLFEREEFIDWLTSDGQSGFWLKGSQGSGKTVIVSRVIEFIQTQCLDEDSTLLYHFCRFSDEVTRSQDRLVGALVTQLLDHLPEGSPLPDALKTMLKRSRFSPYPRVAKLKNVFHELCKTHATIYIVIDALDELSDFKDILGILRFLPQTVTFKIFVAGRQNTELKSAFGAYNTVEIMPEDVETDMQMFVRDRLEELLSGDEEEIDPAVLVMELANRADGMFLWAVCQVQYLSQIRTTITPDLIANLPPALESIFENVLTRLNDEDRKLALRILQIVMFAFRPLDLSEIVEAIAITASTTTLAELHRLRQKSLVLDLCGCMLVQSPRTKKVRLAHSSVHEFLSQRTADSITGQNRFFLDETISNRELLKICIRYLSMEDFDSDTFRETFRLAQDGDHTNWDLQVFAKAPLLEYAVNHLLPHMKALDFDNKPDVGVCFIMTNKFFHQEATKFMSWLLVQQYLHGTYKIPPGSNAFHVAAVYGVESMFSWVDDITKLKAQTVDGRNVLHLALENQQSQVVTILLMQRSINLLNDFDGQGRSPLHIAVELGNSTMVQRLADAGADPNIASSQTQGRTPIFMAVENRWDELSEYLSLKADMGLCLDDGRSLQHVAAQSGSLAWISALQRAAEADNAPRGLVRETHKSRRDDNGWTPLHYAADLGQVAIVPKLMIYGYAASDMDQNGWTPLHAAIRRRYLSTAAALLEHTKLVPEPPPISLRSFSRYSIPASDHQSADVVEGTERYIGTGTRPSSSVSPRQADRLRLSRSTSGKYGGHLTDPSDEQATLSSSGAAGASSSSRPQRSGMQSFLMGRPARHQGRRGDLNPSPPSPTAVEAVQSAISVARDSPSTHPGGRFPVRASPNEVERPRILSPLHVAVADSYTEGVDLLVEHHEKLYKWGLTEEEEFKCLQMALEASNVPIALLLLGVVGHQSIKKALPELIAAKNNAINSKIKDLGIEHDWAYDKIVPDALQHNQHEIISFVLKTWPNPKASSIIHSIEASYASLPQREPQQDEMLAGLVNAYFSNNIADGDVAKEDSNKSSFLTQSLDLRALHAAALIIERGANVNFRDRTGETPLLALARLVPELGNDSKSKPFIAFADLLVTQGADPCATDLKGEDMCHKAALQGNSQLVEWALKNKVPPNSRNIHARTPLVLAVERGATECVRLLLDFLLADGATGATTLTSGPGRVIDAMDYGKMRTSPLLRALVLRPERKISVLTQLVEADEKAFSALSSNLQSDVAGLRASMYTDALCWAIDCEFPEGFEYLLPRVSTYALLCRRSIDGETVLHGATRARNDDPLKALLQKIEALGDQGKSVEVVNIQDTRKRTPLVLAVEAGSADKVAALLQAGARPSQVLVDVAKGDGKSKIVQILEKYLEELKQSQRGSPAGEAEAGDLEIGGWQLA